MDFTTRPRKNREEASPRPHIKIEHEDLYPHNVLLYDKPPIQDITLEEFEELALNRLKVLRIIEQESTKGNRIYSDEWKQAIKEELKREGLNNYDRLLKVGSSGKIELDIQARRADYISHFILRFSYCRSTDMIRFVFSFLLFKFFQSIFFNLIPDGLLLVKWNFSDLNSPV